MNRSDDCLLGTIVTDRLTDRADAAGNASIRDRLPLPDRCDDLVFRDHAIAVSDKMDKQGKDLRLQTHRSVAVAELKPLLVEQKITE